MRGVIGTAVAAALLSGAASAADVVRHKIPNSDFPIAQAVEVPAGKTVVYLSGAVPTVTNAQADKATQAAYGDTEAQTASSLRSIQGTLQGLGLTMGDVIRMQVFLVGDPAKGGNMDFAGFMKGYTQFFGTPDQPNLPTRSVFQVAGLASPAYLIEIEVTAVRR